MSHSEDSTSVPPRTVGLDLADRHTEICVIDRAGEVGERGQVRTTREALRRRFTGEAVRIVLEVGAHSPWVSRYPETELLRQVEGVGAKCALCFVLTIEDPTRFRRSRSVGPYLGLVPRQSDSGETERRGRITKKGDGLCRRLLVQSAHYILGPLATDSDLRRWGKRLEEESGQGGRKRAAVAVARKLAVLLHRLWVTGDEYDPLYQTGQREETEAA